MTVDDTVGLMFTSSSVLIGHGLILIIFGVFGLMLSPVRMLGKLGREMSPPQLNIYRICGLWVACAGAVSCYSGAYLESIHQQAVCSLLVLVHFTEVLLKFQAGRLQNAVGNAVLGVLMLAAAVSG